jgi:hypothetical protein
MPYFSRSTGFGTVPKKQIERAAVFELYPDIKEL